MTYQLDIGFRWEVEERVCGPIFYCFLSTEYHLPLHQASRSKSRNHPCAEVAAIRIVASLLVLDVHQLTVSHCIESLIVFL